MRRTHFGQHGDACFGCKVHTVQMDPRALPSRKVAGDAPPNISSGANSWERGIVKDERGMPLLGPNGFVGVKEMANNRGNYQRQIDQMDAQTAAARRDR